MSNTKAAPVVEEFQMHPRLLWDVITRQAGSISKAMLEGVMNTIDAGATKGVVTLTTSGFSIKDDGKGMTLEEIQRNFKMFGQPHEAGDAQYGRYRMGRGQMFSFGRNVWKTGSNVITVDLKPQMDEKSNTDYKLGFQIDQSPDFVKGCEITVDFYDDLAPRNMAYTVDDITKQVKYVSVPITINGKQVNTPPETLKWDEETEFGYFKTNGRTGLDVYNMGVYVCTLPTSQIGVSGVFVSKQALEVNFARNNVVQTCKLWKAAQKVFDKYRTEKKEQKASLTDGHRENICRALAQGVEDILSVMGTSILKDVTGSNITLTSLAKRLDKTGHALSIAPTGDRVGERAVQRGVATVLSQETLDRFGLETWAELRAVIDTCLKREEKKNASWDYYHEKISLRKILAAEEIKLEALSSMFSTEYETLGDDDLSFQDKVVLAALRVCNSRVAYAVGVTPRIVRAGRSGTADGWTNGSTTIHINVRRLEEARESIGNVTALVGILLHEYLHDGSSVEMHTHDMDFYKKFHDTCLDSGLLGNSAEALINEINRELNRLNKGGPFRNKAFRTFNEIAKGIGVGDFLDGEPSAQEVEPQVAAPVAAAPVAAAPLIEAPAAVAPLIESPAAAAPPVEPRASTSAPAMEPEVVAATKKTSKKAPKNAVEPLPSPVERAFSKGVSASAVPAPTKIAVPAPTKVAAPAVVGVAAPAEPLVAPSVEHSAAPETAVAAQDRPAAEPAKAPVVAAAATAAPAVAPPVAPPSASSARSAGLPAWASTEAAAAPAAPPPPRRRLRM